MPLIERDVAGERCQLIVLPKETAKNAEKFYAFIESDEILGLDVETTSIDEEFGIFDPSMRLRMVQFGTASVAWAIDGQSEFWRPRLAEVLALPTKRFVTHTNYDVLWCDKDLGVDLDQRGIDLMPMASLLYPGNQRKDLKSLCDKHIDTGLTEAQTALHERFKALAPTGSRVGKKCLSWGFTNIPLDDPIFGAYAGLDAIYARRLLPILNQKLIKAGMAKLSIREQRIQRLANRMQKRGFRLDKDYTEGLLREIEDEYLAADKRVATRFGFSPRSPKRGNWLEAKGAFLPDRTPSGAPKLDKDVIEEKARIYKNHKKLGPIFADLEILSSRQNFLNNLRVAISSADAQGFNHPKIRTQAALTGRMSVVKPAMQTFKKRDPRLRRCWISRDGYVFVGADYDNQEVRIAAAFSGDPMLHKIVFEKLNQHKLTAAAIFGEKYTEEEYDKGKILDFAQQYGAMPKKIGDQMGLPRGPKTARHPDGSANPQALKMWLAWRKTYKGLVKWSDYVAGFSTVQNPWGRVIPASRGREYANGNYAIQSSGRDVLGDAMIKLEDWGYADYLWLPIHDELVLEVPEDRAEEFCGILERAMYCEIGSIPLTATAKVIGKRWGGEPNVT